MNVCCTCNDGYVLPLRVMLNSLSRYNDDIEFWLVYSDIKKTNLDAIAHDIRSYGWLFHFVKIDDSAIRLCDSLPAIRYFSKEVYYRLLIPWALPDCDRVLYLDCDMLVRGALSELYAVEMGGAVIGAVPDSKPPIERENIARLGLDGRYCNSGMLLIDSEAIRGCYTQEEMCSLIAKAVVGNNLVYPDQDLINLIYQCKILTLDTVWNFTTNLKSDLYLFTHRAWARKIKVLHYIGDTKPWHSNYIRWLVFEYWNCLRLFLTEEQRRDYWRRKGFMRAQLMRVPKKIARRLCR